MKKKTFEAIFTLLFAIAWAQSPLFPYTQRLHKSSFECMAEGSSEKLRAEVEQKRRGASLVLYNESLMRSSEIKKFRDIRETPLYSAEKLYFFSKR